MGPKTLKRLRLKTFQITHSDCSTPTGGLSATDMGWTLSVKETNKGHLGQHVWEQRLRSACASHIRPLNVYNKHHPLLYILLSTMKKVDKDEMR